MQNSWTVRIEKQKAIEMYFSHRCLFRSMWFGWKEEGDASSVALLLGSRLSASVSGAPSR